MSVEVVGRPLSRAEGPAKVTGRAVYTADTHIPGVAYGVLIMSRIPSGHVTGIDSQAALASPGVLAVITPANAPRLKRPQLAAQFLPLQDDVVRHEGQPVALLVAESLEDARHAARLVEVSYERTPPRLDFRAHLDEAVTAQTFLPADFSVGDVEAGLAVADAVVDQTYRTADRHHNPMETSVTIAEWRGGDLTIHDSTQWVWGVRAAVAEAFGLAPERVRVHSDFVGGGFGSKGFIWPHQILAPLAAQVVGRPVRLVLTKADAFTSHGHQPATEQGLTLGARRDGTLLALRHTSSNPTSEADTFVEYVAAGSPHTYACPAIETRHRVVRLNRSLPTPMRAPWEGMGMVGLEIAMDELAYKLQLDPLELRLRNYAETDPGNGLPFSSKRLRDCYRRGAERFGWQGRQMQAGSMRDRQDLIGWGMASAQMTTFRNPANARVTIDRQGRVLVEAGSQEIGTGVLTIMPQIVADVLGLDPDVVRMRLGDTTLPETGGTFGSSTTMGVGSAVRDAAVNLLADLGELAGSRAPDPQQYGELLGAHGLERLSADGSWAPGREVEDVSMHTFGAVFAEVRVDEDLPIVRLARLVGVYSAGRVINPKLARSQMSGAMIWGLGQALLESSEMDPGLGRFLSKNLAGYLVPVSADVPELDASFIEDEYDPHAGALGAKGIGELGAVGVGPAIANAVFHATGVRVRELPIRPEMLMGSGASVRGGTR
ncbi:MAG: xanthine dehydrogenase family protein molybdopterin-binding subunit [Candidatus Dormibacteraeota bacterium]|nr:xanthine dehydrogenase family protein molybdopterin-binding subunit [Candidatus Dormibacteraeota bacterium]